MKCHFSDNIKIVRHRETLAAISAGRGILSPPLHVRLEPTESCLFQCDFCWWHNPERAKEISSTVNFNGRRYIEMDRMLALIDEMADAGVRAVSFTGAGEPLLYPWLDIVLEKIRKRGMVAGVTSVLASILSDTLVEQFANLKWLRWSVNAGTVPTFSAIHNPRAGDGQECFDRVMENVRRINRVRKKMKNPAAFNASFVVADGNRGDVLSAARLTCSLGVDSIVFRPDKPMDRDDDPLCYSDTFTRDILSAKEELETNGFHVFMGEDRLEEVRPPDISGLVCFYSNHSTYIAASGDVYPCCYTRHLAHYSMGNIFDREFGEFWHRPERRENYKKLLMDSCPPCPHARVNGILKSLYETGESQAEFPLTWEEPDFFI